MTKLTISVQNIMAGDKFGSHGHDLVAATDAEFIKEGTLMGGISVKTEDGPHPFIYAKWDNHQTLIEVERNTDDNDD